jgi:phosphoribosylanthranilate isomerase
VKTLARVLLSLKNGANMRVKICGITNIEDALLCSELKADAVGFIFYKRSNRFISIENAKEIIKYLPSDIKKVGVFVNQNPEEINIISKEIKLSIVQLHFDSPPSSISKFDLPVIKSFMISNDFDFDILNNYNNCTFLLDTFSPTEAGGTGKSFDWNLIPHELRNRIILAGGISINNIEDIFKKIHPYAVDLSSSLEQSPGKKDVKKLKDFFNKVNQLRNAL